jgi:uncharacterized membrane protein YedE/YeeE
MVCNGHGYLHPHQRTGVVTGAIFPLFRINDTGNIFPYFVTNITIHHTCQIHFYSEQKNMNMIEWIKQPWPWYIAGPLIGLMVPALLLIGNKSFGISSSFRHICAACFPSNIRFFQYNWKNELWSLFFVAGILAGGIITSQFLTDPSPVAVNPKLATTLEEYGINNYQSLVPKQLFNWDSLFTLKGFILMVVGGFLVGFGTRYAGGCTSGHAIMGLSTLQLPSLIATISFMAGGFIVANLILPLILKL